MSVIESIDAEKSKLRRILASVPFTKNSKPDGLFLDVYRITRQEILNLYEPDDAVFNDSNRILKLGISLGNLIRTWNNDEHTFNQRREQYKKKKQETDNLASLDPKMSQLKLEEARSLMNSPFVESNKYLEEDERSNQISAHHMKFLRNLVSLLKSFNIGTPYYTQLGRVSSGSSRTTINSGSLNQSPIKLNSRQLLIEKLEINIDLDTVFVFEVAFQLILRIYDIIQIIISYYPSSNSNEENPALMEVLSIFSSESNLLSEIESLLRQAMSRISSGLIEPFLQMIFINVVKPNINNASEELITRLSM